MEEALDFIKIALPAGLAIYAMHLTISSFLKKDFEKKLLDIKHKSTEIILPNRLQAYERMTLFLERISPGNLILRVNDPSYTAKQLQAALIRDIRDEFNHNLSQQVYMSDEVWKRIKNTVEELIALINEAEREAGAEAKGIDLAKVIFSKMSEDGAVDIDGTIRQLKGEIQRLF